MTEAEWLKCKKRPDTMLTYLADKAGERKLRLYACASARELWARHEPDNFTEQLLSFGELIADGLLDKKILTRAAEKAWRKAGGGITSSLTTRGQETNSVQRAVVAAILAQSTPWNAAGYFTTKPWLLSNGADRAKLCLLIREVFGNPFRPGSLDPAWRTPAVLHLAQALYDDRAFEQLPILADALEEAGCTSRDVLDHCRGPGPHVRGCWAVDLVLGKG